MFIVADLVSLIGLSVGSVNKTTKLVAYLINRLSTIGSSIRILANSADPYAAFDQSTLFAKKKRSSVKEYIFFEIELVAPQYIQLLAIVYCIKFR